MSPFPLESVPVNLPELRVSLMDSVGAAGFALRRLSAYAKLRTRVVSLRLEALIVPESLDEVWSERSPVPSAFDGPHPTRV